MKNKPLKKRIIWQNFLKLMGVSFLFVLLAMWFIYQSSLSVVQEQFLQVNEQRAEMISDNADRVLRQMKKVAASLCVDEDSFLFFEDEEPERVDEGLYKRLYSKLKTYSFGMDFVHSIILYSPAYERMLEDSEKYAMYLKDAVEEPRYDTSWVDYLPELEACGPEPLIKIRSVNNRYPHVLTLLKRYKTISTNGVVILNLDLKELYSTIWTENSNHVQVYVLDKEGRIVISKGKSDLYEYIEEHDALKNFVRTPEKQSFFIKDAEVPYTYAQQYKEEYGFYYVTVSYLDNYYEQIHEEQKEILLIFLMSVLVIGALVLLYCTSSFQPLQSIMELLEDPKNWLEKGKDMVQSSQIHEIVEQTVHHLQVNDELRQELDHRLGILRETQVQALQSQLNPHFLFNSLDAIGMMLEEREEEDIAKLVECLMDILRYSLSDKEMVNLETEIGYLQKYVYIMECRYGNTFTVEFCFDEEIRKSIVPRLLIQPLIENAVFHGIAPIKKDTAGKLSIRGKHGHYKFEGGDEETDIIQIEVEDNGYGMTSEKREQLLTDIQDLEHINAKHIGLQNVAKRLYLLFPGQVRIDIRSERDRGTCITLIFPRSE